MISSRQRFPQFLHRQLITILASRPTGFHDLNEIHQARRRLDFMAMDWPHKQDHRFLASGFVHVRGRFASADGGVEVCGMPYTLAFAKRDQVQWPATGAMCDYLCGTHFNAPKRSGKLTTSPTQNSGRVIGLSRSFASWYVIS